MRADSGLEFGNWRGSRTWMYTVGWVHGGTLFAYRNGGTGPVKELLDTSNTCESGVSTWLTLAESCATDA